MDPYFVLWDQDEAEAIQEQNYEFEFDLRELGIGGKAEVRDLWRQQDLGTCRARSGRWYPTTGFRWSG